jgi:hypothetical protein
MAIYRYISLQISCPIELYPESLAEATTSDDYLPLHLILLEKRKLSSIEDATMMMEKYPAASG